ncbi:hypothetical protein M413DRAFT_25129 [Hebeloma cylindrosporum]|uniref:Deacetylase sirtuin-type domain-containing protein n=1 Tax=Hebeloma cylindrosporum TaxID=76867 RepID=A0A0C3CLP8_HEBCY|nr:hypothetical protein M413DRAFT_25129 [Hebeloma cylindrosporum h7]
MRVSVPGIPQAILDAKHDLSIKSISEATKRLAEFIGGANVTLLTGAGVSVDSGIRAYRGEDGRYMNPNYKPIFYHELMDSTEKGQAYRRRYWLYFLILSRKQNAQKLHSRLRSYLGYPSVRDALPNTTHFSLAALQHTSHISHIITQNVDGLHHKALRNSASLSGAAARLQDNILELHGTLHRVHCSSGHKVDRDTFQDWLSAANPEWRQYAEDLERTGTQPRTNPDGDVAIEHLGISYSNFVIPECPQCMLGDHINPVHKPGVIFFGESIPSATKERSFREVEASDKFLIMGTTLATYSAFRLVKHALELKKPIMLLNVGPTRADGLPGVEKIDVPSGAVMRQVAKEVIGTRAGMDPVIIEMLESGTENPPPPDDDDRAPRAAG